MRKDTVLVRPSLMMLVSVATAMMVAGVVPVRAQTVESGPSAFCHATDGTFTDCDGNPGTGLEEWSDITPSVQSESGGVVYVDQADLVDNSTITPENEQNGTIDFTPDGELDHLMLMYEDDRTVPLGPDEYVLVHFMTVDEKEGEEEDP